MRGNERNREPLAVSKKERERKKQRKKETRPIAISRVHATL